VNRAAVYLAALAVILAAAALVAALDRPQPLARYPLVCGMSFTDARTGRTAPVFVPCSPRHP
jgi:hypothetical protein